MELRFLKWDIIRSSREYLLVNLQPATQKTQSQPRGAGGYLLLWLAVAVWAAMIFYFSNQPSLSSGLAWDYILRKIAHMAEFVALMLLLRGAIRQHGVREGRALAAATALAFIYAVSDEYHQSFVSGRTASARDVGFDLAGILAAVLIVKIFIARQAAPRAG